MKITTLLNIITITITNSLFIPKYEYKNPAQIKYNYYIESKKFPIVVTTGLPGTGKTMIACHTAIKLFQQGKYKKIIITRPTVSVDEDLGFLPGTLNNKMHPFLIPIYDYFLDYYTNDQLTCLINSNKLEISPLAYMRGRTFSDSIVIADEMQNSSINQIKMLLTRIGSNSKIILTGDLNQSDINGMNGLENFYNLLMIKYPEYFKMLLDGFAYINLDKSCIERHEIISKIIELYE
jgi:phosphate starvation-inducible PhoH-like protein